jgi:hypothetical protein
VYYRYPYAEKDMAVIKLPKEVKVETLPDKKEEQVDWAVYMFERKAPQPGYLRLDRTVVVGGILFPIDRYKEMRSFFGKLKAEDEQQVLLKVSTDVAEAGRAN